MNAEEAAATTLEFDAVTLFKGKSAQVIGDKRLPVTHAIFIRCKKMYSYRVVQAEEAAAATLELDVVTLFKGKSAQVKGDKGLPFA